MFFNLLENYEIKILEFLNQINHPVLNFIFYLISEVGSLYILIFVLAYVYWCKNKSAAKRIGFICITSICLNNFVKLFFYRKRPFELAGKEYLRKLTGSKLSDGATGSSFPSGHSQIASNNFIVMNHYLRKKEITFIFLFFLIFVPLSRLYLGVHFPTDVLAGVFLGIVYGIGMIYLLNKFMNKTKLLYLFSLIFFLPSLFFKNAGLDVYRSFGMLLGAFLSDLIDDKYLHYLPSNNSLINTSRFVFGLIILLLAYFGIHKINHFMIHTNSILLLNFSYILTHVLFVLIVLIGIPYSFNKIPFLKEHKNNE